MVKELEQKFSEALVGINRLRELERVLKSEGLTLWGPESIVIRHDGQEIGIRTDGPDLIVAEPFNPNSTCPYSVEFDGLLERVERLIGTGTPIRAEIGGGIDRNGNHNNLQWYMRIDELRDNHQVDSETLIFVRGNKVKIGYRSDGSFYGDPNRPIMTIFSKGDYDPKLIDFLKARTKSKRRENTGGYILVLNQTQSLADFMALADECGNTMQGSFAMLNYLAANVPVGKFGIYARPPYLWLSAQGDRGVDYMHRDNHDTQPRRKSESHLRVHVPLTELAKAAEFYEGLKIQSR